MPSPDTQDQQQLVEQADKRMCECFEKLTGDSLHEPEYLRFYSLLHVLLEEFATLRRMQGKDGIRWGRDEVNYHAAKVARLDRVAAAAAKAAKTTEATENTEDNKS